jgi:hypothetical protein
VVGEVLVCYCLKFNVSILRCMTYGSGGLAVACVVMDLVFQEIAPTYL